MEKRKGLGIVIIFLIAILAVCAFLNFKGYHSSELGSTHATIPTEAPVPPATPQKDS